MSALHIISLGAGVQSTTMLLMALHGEIEPLPDAAIFADTRWERQVTYRHLDWCEEQIAGRFPLYRVTAGDLRADVLAFVEADHRGGWRIPFHTAAPDGRPVLLGRQCTREYKIRPIQRMVASILKERGRDRCIQWIGVSVDEAHRMRPSGRRDITNRWPLIERRLSRHDCLLWLERHGYPRPPRSACIGCTLRRDDEWREIKDDPEAWADAVDFDARVRRLRGRGEAFLHRSLRPLPLVDLTTPQERGQLELWDTECEGMCGV